MLPARSLWAAGTTGCPAPTRRLTRSARNGATKNKVDIHIDYITSQGEKDKLTAAAEAQAGTGHDIMSHRDWNIQIHERLLEPLDDVVAINSSSNTAR